EDSAYRRDLHSFPTRRSSDLGACAKRSFADSAFPNRVWERGMKGASDLVHHKPCTPPFFVDTPPTASYNHSRSPKNGGVHGLWRSEEHTSELQSRGHLVCRLL